MRIFWFLAVVLAAGCASFQTNAPDTRQFEAPLARVKPAFISAVTSMGMSISALEVRGGREIIKARKAGNDVEIELDPTSKSATRARVTTKSGDEAMATRILQQAGRILGGS